MVKNKKPKNSKESKKKSVHSSPTAKKNDKKRPVKNKKKVLTKKLTKTPPAENKKKLSGISEKLRDSALKVLSERQAEDIVTVSVAGRSSVADYIIIASGRAGRQITAIANYLREAFLKMGVRHVRVEGQSEANWVLIDGGDVIVHLFRPEVRHYYDLDSIWTGKPAPR